MDISELLNRVSTAIAENNLSTVIDDVQMLVGEIDNLNTNINDLSAQVGELTDNNNNLKNEIEMNRKTIANLVRQIPVQNSNNLEDISNDDTNYLEILEGMMRNG